MRIVWVDAGNDPAYSKLDQHDINGVSFDIRENRLDWGYLDDKRNRGYSVSVYTAPNWPEYAGMSAAQYADATSARVQQINADTLLANFPKVQFDMEMHDPGYVEAVLRRWRQLQPNRDTSWTMESFQGGWMGPVVKPGREPSAFVKAIIALKVRVVPQYYKGNMEPFAQDTAMKNLLDRGFPHQLVSGFYDAAHLPVNWDGWAFTQGRLP